MSPPRRNDPTSARSFTVKTSVTAAELIQLRQEAHDRSVSVSGLVHQKLGRNGRPLPPVEFGHLAKALGQINNNLNQIAKRLHMGFISGVTAEQLRPLLEVIGLLRLTLLGGGK